jgi:hypothetical protein
MDFGNAAEESACDDLQQRSSSLISRNNATGQVNQAAAYESGFSGVVSLKTLILFLSASYYIKMYFGISFVHIFTHQLLDTRF